MQSKHQSFVYAGRQFLRIPLSAGRRKDAHCTVPARIAGRYEVRELLAHGGGGVVLVGYDQRTNHEVLIKTVLGYRLKRYANYNDTAGAVEHIRRLRHRLQTERRILVQLCRRGVSAVPHPNNYVYDVNPGLADRHSSRTAGSWHLDDDALLRSEPFLVMERIYGTSLHELLKGRFADGMPRQKALRIMLQICSVLQAAHEPFSIEGHTWQIVYQDVKPGNILVSDSGRSTLVDFGGCQLLIDDTLVLTGAHTPGYCPPEQGPRYDALGLRKRPVPMSRLRRIVDLSCSRLANSSKCDLGAAREEIERLRGDLVHRFDLTTREALLVVATAARHVAGPDGSLEAVASELARRRLHIARLTPAADIYGVGSTLYHMLTGTNPQRLLSRGNHSRKGAARPSNAQAVHHWDWEALAKKCGEPMCRLLQRCLAADPADRFPEMAAVGEELQVLCAAVS